MRVRDPVPKCDFSCSEPERSRPYLGVLLLANYTDDGRLIYAGRAGTGMSDRKLRRLYDRLKPLTATKMPLDAMPPENASARRSISRASISAVAIRDAVRHLPAGQEEPSGRQKRSVRAWSGRSPG